MTASKTAIAIQLIITFSVVVFCICLKTLRHQRPADRKKLILSANYRGLSLQIYLLALNMLGVE